MKKLQKLADEFSLFTDFMNVFSLTVVHFKHNVYPGFPCTTLWLKIVTFRSFCWLLTKRAMQFQFNNQVNGSIVLQSVQVRLH